MNNNIPFKCGVFLPPDCSLALRRRIHAPARKKLVEGVYNFGNLLQTSIKSRATDLKKHDGELPHGTSSDIPGARREEKCHEKAHRHRLLQRKGETPDADRQYKPSNRYTRPRKVRSVGREGFPTIARCKGTHSLKSTTDMMLRCSSPENICHGLTLRIVVGSIGSLGNQW